MFTEEELLSMAVKGVGGRRSLELAGFKLTPSSSAGYLGETFLLEIQIRSGEERETETLEFFVKRVPRANGVQERLVRESGVFAKEIGLYRNLLERFEEHVAGGRIYPRYIHSRGDELLVLEQLAGFVTESTYAYFTLDQCQATLAALAKFHAASIIFEIRNSTRIDALVPQYLQESIFLENVDSQLYQHFEVSFDAVDAILNAHYSHLSGDILKKVRHLVRTIRHRFRRPKRENRCNVLSHGDLWASNVMFKYDQQRVKEVRFVDFQLARYAPPSIDVLMLLHSTLSRDERQLEWKHLTAYYYDSLAKALDISGGVDIDQVLGWPEFELSLREELPTILSLAILYLHYIKIPRKSMAQVMKNPQLYHQVVSVNRDHLVLESMKTDSHYNKAIKDAVEDIIQYVQTN